MKYKLGWAQGQSNAVTCATETDEVPRLSGPRGCLLGHINRRPHKSVTERIFCCGEASIAAKEKQL